MNLVELTTEQKRLIYDRQSGMCAFTGRKFEQFTDTMEVDFAVIDNKIGTADNNNIVMVKQYSGLAKITLRKYIFQHANFSNYDATQKADEFKLDVDEVVSLSSTSENTQDVRNRINDLTKHLQGLGLTNSIRNEFRELLKTANDNLKRRTDEVREKDKELWKANYDMIKEKVNAAIEFAKNTPKFKESREKLIEVQKELRDLKLNPTDKNELITLLNEEFKSINEKIQDWSENNELEIIENYHTLRNLIDDTIQKAFSFETFPEARDILVELQKQVREKNLRKVQKDELFAIIRNAFDDLREKFTEYKRVTDEEAAENYNTIKPQVDAAVEFAKSVSAADANAAREKFIQVQNMLKAARLKREQKDELFTSIREVFTTINEMSNEERKKFDAESEENYKNLLSKIELTLVDIENAIDFRQSFDDLESIKTELQLANLKRTHKSKLYDKLFAASNLLGNKRTEYNKYRFAEKKKRLKETLDSMQQKKERFTKLLAKDKELLNAQNEKLSTIPEDNTLLREKNQQIINEINSRMSEKEKIIHSAEKRISSIEKEMENTIKAEQELENRIQKRAIQQAEKEREREKATNEEVTESKENANDVVE